MKVSRILHAGYVFEHAGTQVLFDPIFENPFSVNNYAFPNVRFDLAQIRALRPTAVFISHYHEDHCSIESLNLLNRATHLYLYCLHDELFAMLRELGFKNVHALQLDRAMTVGAFTITPRRALDEEIDSIFQIEVAGLKILNIVDSWIPPQTLWKLAAFAPWDLVLWPFQAMRELEVLMPTRGSSVVEFPHEWTAALKALRPRYIVPSSCQFQFESWSWLNHAFFPISYERFQREVDSPIIKINPGASLGLDSTTLTELDPLSWLKPVGPQELDYEFAPELAPTTTAEIAKRFAPLSVGDTARVYEYCRRELIKRFGTLESSEYFGKPRRWRLSLFDHNGEAEHFVYQIEGQSLRPCTDLGPFAWTTEIPLAKLHGALFHGESLTSLYVRVNAVTFAPEVERELAGVEVLEDPLIRCLYTGIFGAYQRTQLKRLIEPKSFEQIVDRSRPELAGAASRPER